MHYVTFQTTPCQKTKRLTRGLSFCPQPTYIERTHLLRDTLLFNRRLRLQHCFKDSTKRTPDPFITPTGWTPPTGKSPTLDTYINITTTAIRHFKPIPPTFSNLPDKERRALQSLRDNSNLIIKPADKGDAVVIMNRQDYINEGLRQLSDTKFYKRLNRDPTRKTSAEIQTFLSRMKTLKLLPDEHITFLTPKNCRTPVFYMLPKIHKENNPGRPIVSACDSPTENLSAYIDSFLKPLAQQVKSYIKDTNHFLRKLNEIGQLPENSLLVTIDVVSLYTNITHREGILAAKDALEKRQTKEPKTWVLLRLLHFVLTKTAFKFNEQIYEQISGTSMGTICAPSFAILFMGKFGMIF